MANYYGASKVQELGTRLMHCESNQPRVIGNTRVIAVVGNGLYKVAPDVTDAADYAEFFNSYSRGNWLTFKLYTLSPSHLEKCPDEGREDDD